MLATRQAASGRHSQRIHMSPRTKVQVTQCITPPILASTTLTTTTERPLRLPLSTTIDP